MKTILIFFLLTGTAFAQTLNWQYSKIVHKEIDLAGKYRLSTEINNGTEVQTIMLKFQQDPKLADVQAEAAKVCYALNNPPPPEPTKEELQAQIDTATKERDTVQASKDKLIVDIKDAIKTSTTLTQLVNKLKALGITP